MTILIRYSILWLARRLGYVYHWMKSQWRPALIWLALITFIAWLVEHLFKLQAGAWFEWWKILAVYALFALLWWAWQAKRRVVVEEFVQYTNDQTKSVVGGLATLLVVRLALLRELYAAVDEQRAIPTYVGGSQSIDATIKVEDVSEFLRGAVSASSKFSLGPLEIPVGTIMALIGRFMQGPRIIGMLRKDKDLYTLTAQMIDSKRSFSWRVDDPLSITYSSDQEAYKIDRMITELAYQMFTDLALGGLVQWRAILVFSEGLQAYRNCLRTPKDSTLNLKQAEKKFLEALAEDEKFYLAYYNLGVVYTELEQHEAAEIAFSRAISQTPDSWEAYYALLVSLFQRQEYESVIRLCERVIALKPGAANTAKAWHWKGLAQRKLSTSRGITESRLNDLKDTIKSHEKAVMQSWIALCIREFKGHDPSEIPKKVLRLLEDLASTCLADLAVAYNYLADASSYSDRGRTFILRRAEGLFRQALFLNGSNADHHFELAKTYSEWGKSEQAVTEYEITIRINPEKPEFWAYLAQAHALLQNKDAAQYACDRALESPSEASREVITKTAEAYEKLGEKSQAQRIEAIKVFLENIKKEVKQSITVIPQLEKLLMQYDDDRHEWEYGQVCLALGRLYFTANATKEAEKYFREAIRKFARKHTREIRNQGLRALLARSLLNNGEYAKALQAAEDALSLDPLSYFERVVLGEVYYKLNEFEQAIAAWQNSIFRMPNTPDIHFKIGVAYIQLALQYHEFTRRNTLFRQATKYLKQALDLCQSDQQEQKGAACYFLGILHFELGEYDDAIGYLRVSQALKVPRLPSIFYLGWAYLKNKEYNESTNQFHLLRKEAQDLEKRKPLSESVDAEYGEKISLGELLALAYWGLSFGYAERDVNLDEALKLIQGAQDYVRRLTEGDIIELLYPAKYSDCEGWILYKKGDVPESIKCLEQAVILKADADVYLHLALVYKYQLQMSKDDASVQPIIIQIQKYCQHVQELDVKREYEQSLAEIRKYVQDKSQELLQNKIGTTPPGGG